MPRINKPIINHHARSAIKKLSWPDLKRELEKVEPTLSTIQELCAELMRCGSLVSRQPRVDGYSARTTFLTAVLAFAEEVGAGEGAALVRSLMSSLETVDSGYDMIHDRFNSSAIARVPPAMRISAVLQRIAAEYESVQLKMLDKFPNSAILLSHFGPTYDVTEDGVPVHPDHVFDVLAECAAKALIMESLRSGWDAIDGTIIVPLSVAVDEEILSESVAMQLAALSWSAWNGIEERFRYLGGTLEVIGREHLPETVATVLDVLIAYTPTPDILQFEFDVRVAEERQRDRTLMLSVSNAVDSEPLPALGDIERGHIPLPPDRVISTEERVAFIALCEIFGMEPMLASERYGGLRLVEWLRGFATLQHIAANNSAAEAAIEDRLLRSHPKIELLNTMTRFGMTLQAADTFLDAALLRRSSRDLFDSPLIARQDGNVTLYGPSSIQADLTRVVLSALSKAGISIDFKGTAFEEDILEFLRTRGFDAQRVHFRRDGREFEFDVVFVWDQYLFILECKNRSLPEGRAEQLFRFREAMKRDAAQVTRLVSAVSEFPEEFVRRFGADVVDKHIVPCIMHSRTYSGSDDIDGIYITDASAFKRFFRGPTIGVKHVSPRAGKAVIDDIPVLRLWKGDKPTPEELIESLRDPIQRRHMAAKLEVRRRYTPLGKRSAALAPFINAKDIGAEEALAIVGGDAAAVQSGVDGAFQVIDDRHSAANR